VSLARLTGDFLAFCDHFGIGLYPWQREAFGRACERENGRFRYRLAGVSIARRARRGRADRAGIAGTDPGSAAA